MCFNPRNLCVDHMPKTKKNEAKCFEMGAKHHTTKNTIRAGYANGMYFSIRREQQELYSGFFENGRCRCHGAVYRFAVFWWNSRKFFFLLAGGLGDSVPMLMSSQD